MTKDRLDYGRDSAFGIGIIDVIDPAPDIEAGIGER